MTRDSDTDPVAPPGEADQAGEAGAVASTERTIIRPWRMEEADRMYDMLRRMEVVKWFGGGVPMKHRDEALARIEAWAQALDADLRYGSWAIVERSSGIPAGTVLLKPLPNGDGEIEIGWHLHPDRWRQGLASEAAAAMLVRGFADGLDEIWAVTHLDNQPSMAVCRRIGMHCLGITNRWYDEPSQMFWVGSREGQRPSLAPDEPTD